MRNELHHCTKPECWIHTLLDEGYEALWPLVFHPEMFGKYYRWSFYVRWKGKRGSRANHRLLCEKHHKQILAQWDSDMRADLQNMEATEAWLTRINSQMLNPS